MVSSIIIRFVLVSALVSLVTLEGYVILHTSGNGRSWHRRLANSNNVGSNNHICVPITGSTVNARTPPSSFLLHAEFRRSDDSRPRKSANAGKPKNGNRQQKSALPAAATARAEQKSRGAKQPLRRPFVERAWKDEERKPLSAFSVGQQVNARVISVVEHGLFLDIGSTKDGLVHIKDISKSYFVDNLSAKYTPGQNVVAWVKFVDSVGSKLGLQLFAPDGQAVHRMTQDRSMLTHTLNALTVGQPIKGTVIRASEFGVDLDIGAEVLAFLHKRKIRLKNSKQARLKTWEITPLGSIVNGYVYEVNAARKRIALTTFAPNEWESNIPQKSDEDDDDDDDDEELGGSVRAQNLRALQRTLTLGDEDDDDDEDDDEFDGEDELEGLDAQADFNADDFAAALDDDEDEGDDEDDGGAMMEEFSLEEIAEIQRARDARKAATANAANTKLSGDEVDEDDRWTGDEGEEQSVDELFEQLSNGNGRGEISLRDIRNWVYVRQLLDEGLLDDKLLNNIFRQASRGDSKLTEETFEDFLEIFTDTMGLLDEVEDSSSSSDAVEDSGALLANQVLLLDDTKHVREESVMTAASKASGPPLATAVNSGGRISLDVEEFSSEDLLTRDDADLVFEGYEDDEDDEDFIKVASLIAPTESNDNGDGDIVGDLPIEKHFERKSKTNDLFQFVFNSVAGKKGHITFEDVEQWDFARALTHPEAAATSNALPEATLRGYFNEALEATVSNQRAIRGKLTGSKLDRTGFELLMDRLSSWDVLLEQSSPSTAISSQQIPLIKAENELDARAVSMDKEDSVFVGDELFDGDELDIEEEFNELADDRGLVSFEAAMGWDLVTEMVDFDFMTSEEALAFYKQAAAKVNSSGKTKTKASAKGKAAGEHLPPLNKEAFAAFFELIAQISDERYELGDHEELLEAPEDYADSVGSEESSSRATPTLLIKSDREREVEMSHARVMVADDDDIDDGELLNSVFDTLTNGKKVASAKDLLNWDFILDLLGEGALDEQGLQDLMKQCGGTEKGVNIEAFDKLVDQLVSKYKDHIGDEEDSDQVGADVGSGDEWQEVSSKAVENSISNSLVDAPTGINNDITISTENEEEVYEFDIDDTFTAISGGKEFATYEELKNWDVVNELFEEGYVDDDRLKAILDNAGVSDSKAIELLDFEAFINELDMSLESLAKQVSTDQPAPPSASTNGGKEQKVKKAGKKK